MKPDFYKAFAPDPVRVLGVDLQPFSLGHAILLTRFGCYPVNHHGDLLLAILLCSQPFEQHRLTFAQRWFGLKMRIWGITHRRFDFIEKVKLFNRYVTEGSRGPDIDPSDKAGFTQLPGAPFLAHLKAVLQSELGYSQSDALNVPYGGALWDYWTHAENKEKASIVDSDRVFALRQQADDMHDRLIKAAKGRLN